ncbi:MAG: DUF2809 domain-containing protein [Ginsengibacter sp.]
MNRGYFHFNKSYFIIASIIFFTEIIIALYVHDNFIRPYFGDFLVVILIYCFLKSFFEIRVLPLAIGVLLFSYVIETLQYYKLVDRLGLQHSKLARIIIGTSFEWIDIISYTAGIAVVILLERLLTNKGSVGIT